MVHDNNEIGKRTKRSVKYFIKKNSSKCHVMGDFNNIMGEGPINKVLERLYSVKVMIEEICASTSAGNSVWW